MITYTHNGAEVIYQTLDKDFLCHLNENGIIPQELPDKDLRYRVFKYEKDGVVKYACVMDANVPDTYIQHVYITTKYPEDGFYEMMLDIDGQISGATPKKMPSRLKIAIDKAEQEAKEWIEKKYPDKISGWFFTGYPEDINKQYCSMIRLALNAYGYDESVVKMIDISDVDSTYLRDIFKI